MVLVVYLFFRYISTLVQEETGKPRRLELAANIYLAAAELGTMTVNEEVYGRLVPEDVKGILAKYN